MALTAVRKRASELGDESLDLGTLLLSSGMRLLDRHKGKQESLKVKLNLSDGHAKASSKTRPLLGVLAPVPSLCPPAKGRD
jgi:hypothetical protein